jgi:hypothetical protein
MTSVDHIMDHSRDEVQIKAFLEGAVLPIQSGRKTNLFIPALQLTIVNFGRRAHQGEHTTDSRNKNGSSHEGQ